MHLPELPPIAAHKVSSIGYCLAPALQSCVLAFMFPFLGSAQRGSRSLLGMMVEAKNFSNRRRGASTALAILTTLPLRTRKRALWPTQVWQRASRCSAVWWGFRAAKYSLSKLMWDASRSCRNHIKMHAPW